MQPRASNGLRLGVLGSFEGRFENWVHWCNLTGRFRGKAGSAEGGYRSSQVWEDVKPRPAWLVGMDVVDAVLLNRVYAGLGEGVRRRIKVLFFRTHWRPNWQAQKLGVHYLELGRVGVEAKGRFEAGLRVEESLARLRGSVSHGESRRAA